MATDVEVKDKSISPTNERGAETRHMSLVVLLFALHVERPLRVKRRGILPYYVDTSLERKLPCVHGRKSFGEKQSCCDAVW